MRSATRLRTASKGQGRRTLKKRGETQNERVREEERRRKREGGRGTKGAMSVMAREEEGGWGSKVVPRSTTPPTVRGSGAPRGADAKEKTREKERERAVEKRVGRVGCSTEERKRKTREEKRRREKGGGKGVRDCETARMRDEAWPLRRERAYEKVGGGGEKRVRALRDWRFSGRWLAVFPRGRDESSACWWGDEGSAGADVHGLGAMVGALARLEAERPPRRICHSAPSSCSRSVLRLQRASLRSGRPALRDAKPSVR